MNPLIWRVEPQLPIARTTTTFLENERPTQDPSLLRIEEFFLVRSPIYQDELRLLLDNSFNLGIQQCLQQSAMSG